MAIDKSLSQAPLGLPAIDDEPAIEIEIELEEDPDEMVIDLDGKSSESGEAAFGDNLAEEMDDSQLSSIASDLVGEFDDDIASRRDWVQTYVDGLELLGLKTEERTEPWEGACGVYHPMLSEALVKFQSETIMETFPAQGPVRIQIIGDETPEKREAAVRVKEDMNYQLTERMVEYRPEHERMLWGLGLAGNAFKKVYYDPGLERQTAMFVPAEDVVVPYGASSLETAERVTHVMRKTKNEVMKLQAAGFYCDVELDEPTNSLDEIEKAIANKLGFSATTDDRYKLLEMHVELCLEDDSFRGDTAEGVALPYVVTIEKSSNTVLAIRRNWDPADPRKAKRNHFVHYSYVPGFGFYAFGLIHLIGAFAKSGTSIIRQLVDSGTLANVPGGFKTKGLRVKGDDTPISPGEWRDVDVASGTMRDNLMPLPYKEPSPTLYQLLNTIVEEGRRFASAADMKISDMSAQAPVGTTLAILERTLKIMSAVQARIHYSMKQEFKLLKEIIETYTPSEYSYEPEGDNRKAKKSDYALVEVIPVSDPNSATMAQKVVQYQAVQQLAQTAPQLYDMKYLHRQMLEAMNVKNVDKLVPDDEHDEKPRDPVSENMNIINGKPVKAFIYQDHMAHIAVHMAAAQDPMIQQMVGQSARAPMVTNAMQAHIAEHMAFEYRRRIEEAAGVPYPGPDAEMDERTELEVSRLAAAAAQRVLAQNQQQAAQEKAQQQANDPILEMQRKELEIKDKEVQVKATKVALDAGVQQEKLEIERERIAASKEIAGAQVGAKIATDKERISGELQARGLELGMSMVEKMNAMSQPPEAAPSKPAKKGATSKE